MDLFLNAYTTTSEIMLPILIFIIILIVRDLGKYSKLSDRISNILKEISDDIDLLLVIHPKNISDATEYAIDQFVLSGRKLIVFADPLALKDEGNNQNPQMLSLIHISEPTRPY